MLGGSQSDHHRIDDHWLPCYNNTNVLACMDWIKGDPDQRQQISFSFVR